MNWTKSPNQDLTKDNRGWPEGKRRKWGKSTEKRIKEIHQTLENEPLEFYAGASAITDRWRKQYPNSPVPPLITIGRILADLGLSAARKKGRNKGASRYLCYPEHTIYQSLGGRVLEADFVGRKYLTGRTEPLNFIAFSFKKEPRLRHYKRVNGQTADNFIKQSELFFQRFERPDFMKVDNCLATIGSASGKRSISETVAFLLKNQVIPIFAVPRRPFSQASIEGNNSVFARKFWNRIDFKSVEEVDEKIEWFNLSSERYLHYQRPKQHPKHKRNFTPKIYFIRQIKEDREQASKPFIDVLNEKIFLPKSYINYFVLAEWRLKQEQLYIHFEKEQQSKMIKQLSFKINPRSKERRSHFILPSTVRA